MTKKEGEFYLLFAFSSDKVQFCEKKKAMENVLIESVYDTAMSLTSCSDSLPEFSVICMLSGCSSKEADNVFWESLGVSGEEVIREICKGRL